MRNTLHILARLTDADIALLLALGQRAVLEVGDRLVTQGTRTEFLDVILDGAFDIRVGPGEKSVARRFRGEFIGEVSFLDERPPSASVVAVERSRVLRIPKARLEERLASDAGLASRFYRALGTMLAFRLRDVTEKQSGATSGGEDELDLDMLDGVDMAARRFEQHFLPLLG